jgi:hypothetical protein
VQLNGRLHRQYISRLQLRSNVDAEQMLMQTRTSALCKAKLSVSRLTAYRYTRNLSRHYTETTSACKNKGQLRSDVNRGRQQRIQKPKSQSHSYAVHDQRSNKILHDKAETGRLVW